MRELILVGVVLGLVACGGSSEPGKPDCSAATCEMVKFTPVSGGIDAGEGLPHLGCIVSVDGCFEAVCHSSPSQTAWCGPRAIGE